MYISRQFTQKILVMRQLYCGLFEQPDEKSDGTICTNDLISVSLITKGDYMKKLLIIISAFIILLFTSCAFIQSTPDEEKLAELLTSHKWHDLLIDNEKIDYGKDLNYNWVLQFKDDGTFAMDMENTVDNKTIYHTLRGTWELDDTVLTILMVDEEISEFNTTMVLKFADNMTDEIIEKDGIDSMIPDYNEGKFSPPPEMQWYVSEKYFCFESFLFTAE
ncbi:MAG: hypothetical protein U0L20_04800 [Ruminococcus sp.]|nr:hypothetical protein [Ruminococcus sp.]